MKVVSTKNAKSYPWGDECSAWNLLEGEDLTVLEESMPPGTEEKWHLHLKAQQFFYVLNGVASFEVGDEKIAVESHEGIQIPPGTPHRVKNEGESELRFILVSQPSHRGDRMEMEEGAKVSTKENRRAISTYVVNSFTNEDFKGNPAGVCLLDAELSIERMQAIAKEMNLSETAFIGQLGSDKYSIRYFSPLQEIPLCGHATLASAKVLFELNPDCKKLHFVNVNGLDLFADRRGDRIEMEFPIYDTVASDAPRALLDALGLNEVKNAVFNRETVILLLEIESSDKLRGLSPDFIALKKSHDSINGVLITAPSNDPKYDFESRFFWPWSGGEEDPVTGASHCFLAPYWAERMNKNLLQTFQCSARSGFMELDIVSAEKLLIRGHAQIFLQGQMNLKEQ